MWLQNGQYNCGPTALANALDALGREVDPDAIEALCKSTHLGTDENQLIQAASLLDVKTTVVTTWPGLIANLVNGVPAVCAVKTVEEYDHWVAVVGALGNRPVIVDSADTRLTFTVSPEKWFKWWAGSEGFYGIALEG